MEDTNMTFEQLLQQFNDDPAFIRAEKMKVKKEAVGVIFDELDGLVNISKLSEDYFHQSQRWFTRRVYAYLSVCEYKRTFTEEEYRQISEALRDIACRLNKYADELDAAEIM